MTKRELAMLLKTLLQALIDQETPKPPPAPPVVEPPGDHRAHVVSSRWGDHFCCARHELEFERSAVPWQPRWR